MSGLAGAIERLYAEFADVPKPGRIDGCPCCINEQEIVRLLASPLREIPPGDLSSYAADAFLTVGGVEDYLYFLPRILEISATEDGWWPDPEVTGRAILAANLDSWSASRLDALGDFLGAVVADAIQSGEHRKLDGWMCAIGRMGLDVRPYLTRIAESPAAVLAYFEDNAAGLPEGRLSNPFWELSNAGHDVIRDWFHSEAIRKVRFAAYGSLMPPG